MKIGKPTAPEYAPAEPIGDNVIRKGEVAFTGFDDDGRGHRSQVWGYVDKDGVAHIQAEVFISEGR